MGERGARNEDVSTEDIDEMAKVVEEAIRAGVPGFTISATRLHLAVDGSAFPARSPEAMADQDRQGNGTWRLRRLQVASIRHGRLRWRVPRRPRPDARGSAETGLPVFYLLQQVDAAHAMARCWPRSRRRAARAARLIAATAVRPPGVLMCLEGSMHPFRMHPTFMALEHLPLPELVAELASRR
jgi:hypothetical protein